MADTNKPVSEVILFLRKANWRRNQYVQIMHKLPPTAGITAPIIDEGEKLHG
jgi:hypothetical protein